jgi:cytochrome c oxidase subunit 2
MRKGCWFIALLSGFFSPASFADWQVNMPYGVTPTSHAMYDLHMIGFWVCVGIGIVVFSVMAYAIIFHRKSRGAKAAKFHEHPTLELIWAIIPLIILIVLAIPATRVLMRIHDTAAAGLNIKVTGYQWKWHYDYLDYHVSFFSNLSTPLKEIKGQQVKNPHYLREVDNPLIVPINTKIRILTTSNDVIHSWWVPMLGIKKDAVPGFINEAWIKVEKPGIYRGQCAELCGMNHGYMPIVVIAKTQAEFATWIKAQAQRQAAAKALSDKKFTLSELSSMGEKIYLKVCAACHQANGQ